MKTGGTVTMANLHIADRKVTDRSVADPGFADRAGSLAGFHFDSIDLAELNGRAQLQRRVDNKFLVPNSQLPQVLGLLPAATQALVINGSSSARYRSVYFDTPSYESYVTAARGRRRRFKLRTRSYVDSGLAFVEVKTKGPRGLTVKHRAPHESADLATLGQRDTAFAGQVLTESLSTPAVLGGISPVLETNYRRSTLLVPGTTTGADVRLTIDTGLSWDLVTPQSQTAPHASLACADLAIVEVKSPVGSYDLLRLLSRNRLRPIKISKYCTGLSLLCPELPARKWSRARKLLNASAPDATARHEIES